MIDFVSPVRGLFTQANQIALTPLAACSLTARLVHRQVLGSQCRLLRDGRT